LTQTEGLPPPVCRHREGCRLCASRDLELVLALAPTPIADEYVPKERCGAPQPCFPLDLHLCRSCGHVQLLDVISSEALFEGYTYRTSVSLGLVEHFGRLATRLAEALPLAPGAFVCEIGSNDGSMLRFFSERGMRVLGVDPAREIAALATSAGIETLPTFFTSGIASRIREERGPAALVIANNVFAHVDDLGDVAEGVLRLLAGDGVFVFEVSYLVDIVENMLFDTVYHEHLCYHTVRPLAKFFARHGMELIDVERIPQKGGSIRGTAQPRGGPRPVGPAVAALSALEAGLRLEQPAPFRAFAARIDEAKRRCLKEVDARLAAGGTVAGYGASATVTTLLHHFDLGSRLAFLADDNPMKQGTFSPGHHLPVVPSAQLLERRPEAVVVLAWAYADPIVQRNRAYREGGGRFIVPLPQLRVL